MIIFDISFGLIALLLNDISIGCRNHKRVAGFTPHCVSTIAAFLFWSSLGASGTSHSWLLHYTERRK